MNQVVNVGRRKTSVARVFLRPAGTGKITVNGKEHTVYFPHKLLSDKVTAPFKVAGVNVEEFDVFINVDGGGITGQAEAVRMGLSRSLQEMNPELRPALKKAGYLTRDSRMVERKKFGKRKARRSAQFSKR
ncbi:MAG: 30S ribosomal protein S9 [Bacteroidia bacterium]